MSRLSIKLGYWSAVLSVILTVVWGIGLVMAMIFFPIPSWTNLADFVAAVRPASLVAATLAQVAAFLLGPLSLILFCSLHDYAAADQKILTRIGLCCIVATLVLGSQMYFVHFNVMRLMVSRRALTGLEQFVEWNPSSAMAASGLLAWTFFWGLALLFVAPIFSGGRLERRLRLTSLICGICGVLGAVGFLFEKPVLMFVYFIVALVGGTTLYVLESLLFKRLEKGLPLRDPVPDLVGHRGLG
ncbi:MAG TPA: hypothetical protein VKM93_08195 [Terriglobia bacterium]|nr:hypothetical protein [Terriglobia bacterium]